MSYIQDKEIFYINSRNRISGTTSNFSCILHFDQNIDYDSVVVLDCSIPKTYYIVDTNNTFILVEDDQQVTITIPTGNYNRTSMRIKLQSLLNSSSPKSYTYTVATQNINQTEDLGKYIFTVTDNTGIQPQFIFTSGLYEQLGFNMNSTYTFDNDVLYSENVINLNPESTLFLRSNICRQTGNDILQNIITVQDASYSYITFINPIPQEYSKEFVQTKSNIYTFTLTDEDGNIIDLNGLNIVITIMLYKKSTFHDMIRRFVDYLLSYI